MTDLIDRLITWVGFLPTPPPLDGTATRSVRPYLPGPYWIHGTEAA